MAEEISQGELERENLNYPVKSLFIFFVMSITLSITEYYSGEQFPRTDN